MTVREPISDKSHKTYDEFYPSCESSMPVLSVLRRRFLAYFASFSPHYPAICHSYILCSTDAFIHFLMLAVPFFSKNA